MTQLTAKPFIARPLTARPFTAYPFGESTSVSNPLVWHAAYPDSDGVMQAQITGEGTPSFTVDDGLLLPDHEGIYRTTAEDTAPWHGARKVQNRIGQSNNISLTGRWAGSGGATSTLNSGGGPSGQNCWEVDCQSPKYITNYLETGLGNPVAGSVVTFSCLVRSATGSSVTFSMYASGSDSTTSITATTSWQRFSITKTLTSVGICSIRNATGLLETCEWQYEVVSGQSVTAPGEYVENTSGSSAASKYFSYENGNTVSSNVVSSAQGATLDPLPSLYGAPSYTNSLTYSNDLTNAAWSAAGSGTGTVALDAAGLTGAPNTASTFADTDGAAYTMRSRLNIFPAFGTNDTAVMRVFIKKDADTSRYPGFTIMGGSTGSADRGYATLNTSTGALTIISPYAGTTAEANSAGDFWEVIVQLTAQAADLNYGVRIYSAISTNFATASAAATGSIIVGNVELHLNKTIAQVRGSAPIITAASTVTTTAISMSYDIANHSDTQGAYYCEATQFDVSATYSVGLVGVGPSGRIISETSAGVMTSYDGTGGATTLGSGTAVAGTSYKYGVAYSTADSAKIGYKDGTAGSEGTYDGEYNAPAGLLVWSGSGFNGAPARPGLIRNIRRYNLNYTAAKAKLEELTS